MDFRSSATKNQHICKQHNTEQKHVFVKDLWGECYQSPSKASQRCNSDIKW